MDYCTGFFFTSLVSLPPPQVETASAGDSIIKDLWDTVIQVAVVQRAAVMVWQLNIRTIRFVRSSGRELRVFTHGHFCAADYKVWDLFFLFLNPTTASGSRVKLEFKLSLQLRNNLQMAH